MVIGVFMLCPRCNLNLIPTNDAPGAYPGAMSRADNETEVCSFCGYDEAVKQFFGGELQPKDTWPIPIDQFMLGKLK
jgi:hypothetical protein